MDDDGESSSDDEFMSPFASLRATFPTPKCESETLTARNDSSFIGARVSPVAFDDDDERNEDRNVIAPFRKALNESIDSSSFYNERTSLLGRRSVSKSAKPSWDEEHACRNNDNDDKSFKEEAPRYSWDIVLCTISGFHLACMALHDSYVWYISYRLGRGDADVAWRLPLLSPSIGTLTRFGAFVPWRVLDGEAWRMITSVFMSSSLLQYACMCGAWYALRVRGSRPNFGWVLMFFMSTITGQLWAMAWEPYSVTGGASWGTCGILCAAVLPRPQKRFLLVVFWVLLFVISLIDTADSLMGTMGSSLFGCACYGIGYNLTFSKDRAVVKPTTKSVHVLSAVVLVALIWLTPVLWIAFRNTSHS